MSETAKRATEGGRRFGVVKDLLVLGLGEGSGRLLAFVATLLLARRLGAEAFGIITLGMTALSWALWPSDLGLAQIGMRESALAPQDRNLPLGGILRLRLLLGVAASLVVAVVLLLFVDNSDVRTISLLFLLATFPTLLQNEWYYQGKQEYATITVMRTLFGGLYLIGVLLVVLAPEDLAFVPICYTAALAIAATAGWLRRDRTDLPTSKSQRESEDIGVSARKRFGRILRRSTPVGLGGLLVGSMQLLPPIVLALVADEATVGHFGATLRLVLAVLLLDRLFIALFFPRITAAYGRGRGPFLALLRRVRLPLIVGSFLVSLLLSLFALPLVTEIYGPDYAPAAPALSILAWFVVGSVMTSYFSYPLLTVGVEKAYFRSSLASTVVTSIAIVVLSLTHGLIGACLALAAGEMITAMLMFREFRRGVGTIDE